MRMWVQLMKRAHLRFPLTLAVLLAALLLGGCAGETEESKAIVATINDYELTQEEFRRRLVEETRYLGEQQVSEEFMQAFLDQTIRKELLIQEAIRQKLDREEKFMRTIERYWENTLIRDVLEKQSKEVADSTVVREADVEALYAERKEEIPDLPPYEEVAPILRDELQDRAMTQALDEWIKGLRGNATVIVNTENLR